MRKNLLRRAYYVWLMLCIICTESQLRHVVGFSLKCNLLFNFSRRNAHRILTSSLPILSILFKLYYSLFQTTLLGWLLKGSSNDIGLDYKQEWMLRACIQKFYHFWPKISGDSMKNEYFPRQKKYFSVFAVLFCEVKLFILIHTVIVRRRLQFCCLKLCNWNLWRNLKTRRKTDEKFMRTRVISAYTRANSGERKREKKIRLSVVLCRKRIQIGITFHINHNFVFLIYKLKVLYLVDKSRIQLFIF